MLCHKYLIKWEILDEVTMINQMLVMPVKVDGIFTVIFKLL